MRTKHRRQRWHWPTATALRRMSLGWKLNLGFGLLVALTLVVVVLNGLGSSAVSRTLSRAGDQHLPATLAATQAQAELLRMVAALHGYLVLSEPGWIDDYARAQASFEANLAAMEQLASGEAAPTHRQRLAELKATYGAWSELSERLFKLHRQPRLNQPGLRLYQEEVRPLSVAILGEISAAIRLQEGREPSLANSALLKDMIDFRSSFDAMMTNLYGFAVVGDFSFKSSYMTWLPLNTAAWKRLSDSEGQLTAEQREGLAVIAGEREQLFGMPFQIFEAVEGERAYEDLFLFRTESTRHADRMLALLGEMTATQQALLQADMIQGRADLSRGQLLAVGGGLLGLLLAVGMAFVFRETIVGSVRRLTGTAASIAAGDLDAHARVESSDELGQLADTFNLMTGRLRTTIASLERQAHELEQLKEAAEAASRAKGEFLANMSHELRTPLNGILGFAQILGRDPSLPAAHARAVGVIHSSGEHLLTLIDDVLDMAKIEARKLDLCPANIHLPALMDAIVAMFQLKAQQKPGIVFTYEQVSPLPTVVYADEKRLRQILINLLGNAIKFTDQGTVTFRVGLVGSPPVLVPPDEERRTTSTMHFEVVDTGIGIHPELLEQIFLPFEQVSDRGRRTEGTGLGLAISMSLAQAMGGRLAVESEFGRGSAFRLELDVVAQWAHQAGPASPVVAPSAAPVLPERELVTPPPEEMAVLLDLALKGELPRLRQRALLLAEREARYGPFMARLCSLAEAFDEDRLLALIERHAP